MSGRECWLHSRLRPPGGAAPAARGCGSRWPPQALTGRGNALGSGHRRRGWPGRSPHPHACGEGVLGHLSSSRAPAILSRQRPSKSSSRVFLQMNKWRFMTEVRTANPGQSPEWNPKSPGCHQCLSTSTPQSCMLLCVYCTGVIWLLHSRGEAGGSWARE